MNDHQAVSDVHCPYIHADSKHFGSSVELHCARTQWYHGMTERQVLILQLLDVSVYIKPTHVARQNFSGQCRFMPNHIYYLNNSVSER